MNSRQLVPTTLGALALGVGVAACGAAGSTQAPRVHALKQAAARSWNQGVPNVPGSGPVDTEIFIDRTTLLSRDGPLASGYLQTALAEAEPTIARGGQISLALFGHVAAHAVNLYTVTVPTLAQEGAAARDNAGETAALQNALEIGLGLSPAPTPLVRQSIAAVTARPGSDVAGAVAQAADDLSGVPSGTATVALVLTDGWNIRQGEPTLASLMLRSGVASGTRQITANAASELAPGTPKVGWLRVAGLASTAGYAESGAKTVQRLTDAWRKACPALPATNCSVTAQS
jgi:hypothetical protein